MSKPTARQEPETMPPPDDLEVALDAYILVQHDSGDPAYRSDVASFCRLAQLSLDEQLQRIGHLLADYPKGATSAELVVWRKAYAQ